jgi:hypothetical protein
MGSHEYFDYASMIAETSGKTPENFITKSTWQTPIKPSASEWNIYHPRKMTF